MLIRKDVMRFIDLVLGFTPSRVPTLEEEMPLGSILEPSTGRLLDCQPCKGSGRILGAICPYCAGAGTVWDD
jgi:hypothetical protein